MDKGFITYVRDNKKIWKIAALVVLGILLILLPSACTQTGSEDSATYTLDEYKERMESDVASLCSSVSGVGKCKVYITFECGETSKYKGSTLIETRPPVVQGVTVICKGAENDNVRYELTDMLTALFGISSNRVAILKLN